MYCNNKDKGREEKVILTNLVIIKATRIQDRLASSLENNNKKFLDRDY